MASRITTQDTPRTAPGAGKGERDVASGGQCMASPTTGAQKASCAVCGDSFTQRHKGQKICPKRECKLKRKANNQNAARRGRPARDTRKPWGWLSAARDENGDARQKRTILHTLEEQTESGEWPWRDIFEGVGPCMMDECPC